MLRFDVFVDVIKYVASWIVRLFLNLLIVSGCLSIPNRLYAKNINDA